MINLTSREHIRELLLQFLSTGNEYYKTHLIEAVVYKLFGYYAIFYQSRMVRRQITNAFQELIKEGLVIYTPYFPLIFNPYVKFPTLIKGYPLCS